MKENKNKNKQERRDANPDPITGAPGSHPVGTGVGAVAGGAAGVGAGAAVGAATGAVGGGPIGALAGGAIGAVAGGLAGKATGEAVNPTEEEAYWRENYRNEPYYKSDYSYDDYAGAYRTGYEGYARRGQQGGSFDAMENEFRTDYERNRQGSKLSWDEARPAARAAWDRFDRRRLENFVGYDVLDRNGSKVGTLECLWSDSTGEPAFIGVKTGWFMGKTHVVPSDKVHVSETRQTIRLPYDEQFVKDAPSYDSQFDMTEDKEREVNSYYGVQRPTQAKPAATASPQPQHHVSGQATPEQATIQFSEEQLKVRKHEVEAGGVRLRKIVKTEVVNQPVEVQREELVIERVPADKAHSGRQQAFNEQDVYIPLRREEAVVEKQQVLKEEVRARKTKKTDRQDVSEEVRREDVEIENSGEAGQRNPRRPAAGDIREREEQPRSQRLRD